MSHVVFVSFLRTIYTLFECNNYVLKIKQTVMCYSLDHVASESSNLIGHFEVLLFHLVT